MKAKSKKLIRVALLIFSVVVAALICGFLIQRMGEPVRAVENIPFETVLENLVVPWEIVFLPNGDMLITERPGDLLRVGEKKAKIPIPGVEAVGEGGLLGLALHPDFEKKGWIYLYRTANIGGKIDNRVERYTLDLQADLLKDKQTIVSGISAARYHDGGRIAFGPDGKLYITAGDATSSDSAQDINSLSGKILRLNDDGTIPGDNPFGNAVYSYGHRNPEGLAWDDRGRLWATEHGRSGILSGFDELNLIEKGKNYGWPVIQGDETKDGMMTPIINSGPSYTWAPAGAIFFEGNILFTGLRGEALYQYNIKKKALTEHFKGRFGRLRAIAIHDDWLYLSTSDMDGRGTVHPGDDRIVRIRLDYIRQIL